MDGGDHHPSLTGLGQAGVKAAYSYVRFSTPQQALGSSRERQVRKSRQYAAEHGLELVELFDEGLSAFEGEHRLKGALGAFLEKLAAGRIAVGSVLIVENLDRLSREAVIEAFSQFMALVKAGITIVTLSDGLAYDRATIAEQPEILLAALLGIVRANRESARKAELVAAGKAVLRERVRSKGARLTKFGPGWLRAVDGPERFRPIPERIEVVRRMFEMTLAGIGKDSIARQFNKEGVPVFDRGMEKRDASRWHASYVYRILTNRAVLGEFTAKGEVFEKYFPAIIDYQTFSDCRDVLTKSTRKRGRVGAQYANLLDRVAFCDICGTRMRFHNKGGGRDLYLRCHNVSTHDLCPNRIMFPYSVIEEILVDEMLGIVVLGEPRHRTDVSEARRTLEAARQRLDTLYNRRERLRRDAEAYDLAGASSDGIRRERVENQIAIQALEAETRDLRQAAEQADQAVTLPEHLLAVMKLRAEARSRDEAMRLKARARIAQGWRGTLRLFFNHRTMSARVVIDLGPEQWHLYGHISDARSQGQERFHDLLYSFTVLRPSSWFHMNDLVGGGLIGIIEAPLEVIMGRDEVLEDEPEVHAEKKQANRTTYYSLKSAPPLAG